MQFLSSHDPDFYGSDPCLIEARVEALDNMMKVGRVILFVACDFKTSIGHQAVAAVTCSWMLLAATAVGAEFSEDGAFQEAAAQRG